MLTYSSDFSAFCPSGRATLTCHVHTTTSAHISVANAERPRREQQRATPALDRHMHLHPLVHQLLAVERGNGCRGHVICLVLDKTKAQALAGMSVLPSAAKPCLFQPTHKTDNISQLTARCVCAQTPKHTLINLQFVIDPNGSNISYIRTTKKAVTQGACGAWATLGWTLNSASLILLGT